MKTLTPQQRKLLRQAQAARRRKRGGRVTPEKFEKAYAAEVQRRRTFRPAMPKTDPYDILLDDNLI